MTDFIPTSRKDESMGETKTCPGCGGIMNGDRYICGSFWWGGVLHRTAVCKTLAREDYERQRLLRKGW